MSISPDHLTFEEHSLLGSSLPRPKKDNDLYIVHRKLIHPPASLKSIMRSRKEQGQIPMTLLSVILEYGDLLMNLERIDLEGRTVRSPRIYSSSQEDLTSQVYSTLVNHPLLKPSYRSLLRL